MIEFLKQILKHKVWYVVILSIYSQRARKLKKVQAKKLVKLNKSKNFFSWNCILGSFKLFPSKKIDFWPFLKWQKMEFDQKDFSWNWNIWFHEFFLAWTFLNFWPTVILWWFHFIYLGWWRRKPFFDTISHSNGSQKTV